MTLLLQITLVFIFIASAADLLVPFIISRKYPNYSHLKLAISELGSRVSPVRKMESANLIFVGALLIIGGFLHAFLFLSSNGFKNLYILGIVIFGLGCIIAGKFPEDPKGEEESRDGKIHGIGSGLGFLFLLVCPLWAVFIDEFKSLQLLNCLFFIMGLVTFTLFIISEKKDGLLGLTGLWQRANLVVLYACLVLNLINFILIQ